MGINGRGFYVHVQLARAAQGIVCEEQIAIDTKIAELTNGTIATAGQVAKISEFVRERGHQLKALTKRSVSAVLARNPGRRRPAPARTAARWRTRLGAEARRPVRRRRRRWAYARHAAFPRRLDRTVVRRPISAAKSQATGYQENLDVAVAAVLSGDLDRVRALGPPLSIVGDIMRSIICAPPGRLLVAGDFSSIEARVLAWLAGEAWKLDVFHRFDASSNPTLDPYLVAAARILKRSVAADDEVGRQLGKTCELAFGFGGGLGAWRRFDDSDTHADRDVEGFKDQWRRSHPATTQFWRRLENAAKRAICTGERGTLGHLAFEFENGTLRIVLPSGRVISYPEAQIVPGGIPWTSPRPAAREPGQGGSPASTHFGPRVAGPAPAQARARA